MLKKTVSGIMLTLLLLGMLALVFHVQPVKASGTIYIRPDGSIEGTTKISSADNVTYYLTDNIIDIIPIVVQRSNIIVDGNGYYLESDGSNGFELSDVNNVTIQNIKISVFYTPYAVIASNVNNLTIRNTTMYNNRGSCITLSSSSFATITENSITPGAYCINGIKLSSSSFNNITGNRIRGNYMDSTGIILSSSSSFNNITGNNIENNYRGLAIGGDSSNNAIYHNNFVGNQFPPDSHDSINVWDKGYPSGGNYWSDYTGVDLYSGPDQNEAGSDGIGDTPYLIAPNNRDNYPLMKPRYNFDVAVTSVWPSKTIASSGEILPVNINVTNQGWSPTTFNLTSYAEYRYIPIERTAWLKADAAKGWNYSIPGPTITANLGDKFVLELEGVDSLHHKFYVDYNGNAFPDAGEPQSPPFIDTSITFGFTADTLGDFTYYCAYHQDTMFGQFVVNPAPYMFKQVGSQNVALGVEEEETVTFNWNTADAILGSYIISAYAKPVPGETDTGDNLYVDGTVQIVSQLNTDIFFTLSPNPANPGDTVLLQGTLLDQNNDPVSSADVRIEYSLDLTTWNYLWTLTTDGVGDFSRTFTAPSVNTYYMKASYEGSATHNPSDHTETFTVQTPTLVETWIYFNFNPNPATPGASVRLWGILVDESSNPGKYIPVRVEYSTNDGATWNPLWTLTTDSYGMFSRAFSAPGAGRYLMRVSWAGTSGYMAASSTTYFIVLSSTPLEQTEA